MNKYYKYKVYNRTLEDHHNLAKLKNIKFVGDSYNEKTHKGNYWMCSKDHIFTASFTNIMADKFLCYSCMNEKYNITITIPMIQDILKAIFNEPYKSKEFNMRNPSCITKITSYKRMSVHGYSKKHNLCFIMLRPEHVQYIEKYHKTHTSYMNEERKINKTISVCEANKVNIIKIPYNVDYMDIIDYLLNKVELMGYTIDDKESILHRFISNNNIK